jgi:hypothetical protein
MKYINGEKLEIEIPDQESVSMTDAQINKKYQEGEIRIVTEQARYPLSTISSMVHSANYKMNPEYQRRHRWDNQRRSALIESLIMNVPIPPVFLYEYEYSSYEVMDGLQRLTAISSFYDGEFALEGLTQWPELNGKTYAKLPKVLRQGVDRRYISSIILLHETAKTSKEASYLKQMVFDRINSGGEKLTPQEKRNANFDGKLNRLCIKLSSNRYLCETFGIPLPLEGSEDDPIHSERASNPLYKTMGDVELVLRFFAYRQRKRLQTGSLENYLDLYLKHGNGFSKSVLEQLEFLFEATIKLAYDLLGDQAFFLYRYRRGNWSWLERATTAVYDPLLFVLSENLENSRKLLLNRTRIVKALPQFYQENYEFFEGRNTNPSALENREIKFAEFFANFVK